jgi:hypothetical protein
MTVVVVLGEKLAAMGLRNQQPSLRARRAARRLGEMTAEAAREYSKRRIGGEHGNVRGWRTRNLERAIQARGPVRTPAGYVVTVGVVHLTRLNTGSILRAPKQPQEYAEYVEEGTPTKYPRPTNRSGRMTFPESRAGMPRTDTWSSSRFAGQQGKHFMRRAANRGRRLARLQYTQFGGSLTRTGMGNLTARS